MFGVGALESPFGLFVPMEAVLSSIADSFLLRDNEDEVGDGVVTGMGHVNVNVASLEMLLRGKAGLLCVAGGESEGISISLVSSSDSVSVSGRNREDKPSCAT